MLRRARFTLPLLAAASFLLGGLLPGRLVIPGVVVMLLLGLVIDSRIAKVEEQRMRTIADQVVAFASEEDRPPGLEVEGGREWNRLVAALNEVARVLRDRFEQLRAERQRIEQLLDAMPAAVLLFDRAGLAYANPAAVDLFEMVDPQGLSPLRAMGVTALQQALDEAAETGQDVDVTARRDDRELMGKAARINAAETALIVTDVTSLRRVEVMRRDFVANASHELKTPVTGMRALADSLHMAMQRDPERAASMAVRIQHEATRLAQLVRDLLDLTRLEEGSDEQVRQPVDLRRLCMDQIERLQMLADQLDVEVHLVDDGQASVIGIAADLKVIVGNLIQNAIQYNQAGGTVSVSVGRRGAMAVVTVTDSGIGIPEADQDRIFERFYRVDKARSRAAGGTGLGLSLVRHAVERQGGTVTVSSVLGEGSRFTLVLPVEGRVE